MLKRKHKIIISFGIALIIVSMGVFGGPYNGTVYEVETGSPVSDARVIIEVNGIIPMPAHAGFVHLKTIVTTTDSNGKFSSGIWFGSPKGIFIVKRHVYIKAEKKGYRQPPIGYEHRGKRIYVSKK